jgi:ribonuclease R
VSKISDATILRKIEHQPKHSAGYKQLVREMGLHGSQRQELSERLRVLVDEGKLIQSNSNHYSLPKSASKRNVLTGRLTMHRDGYGFVVPDLGALDDRLRQQIVGDVFVAPPYVGSAMHGDRVTVQITQIRQDGRAEGHIVRVARRAHPTVVGTFHYGDRHNYVRPMDEKIRQDVIIPPGMETPRESIEPSEHRRKRGTKSPHRVLGEQSARKPEWDDLENVVVDVELTEWPTNTQSARGRVIEILGYENDFGVDVEVIIRKFHLPHRCPSEVLREAQEVEAVISSSEVRKRRDYRQFSIVTIDGETARDFDDAVLVSKLPNGNYELQVHIADVGHYVKPGSTLDQEARVRGTSVYFPDRAVPMLPLELSTDICSLRPKLDRLVMSCVMEIDHRGEVTSYEINPGVIRSAERMTYTDVNLCLQGDDGARKRYAHLVDQFGLMRELQEILNRKRERRGSIDFDLPEPVIEFDENGLMKGVTRSERNVAHRIIEEFMLAANETVAHYLESKRIASLYRVHDKPDAKRVYDFETIAATFGYSLGVGALPIERVQTKADRRASYGTGRRARTIEVPKEVHITPRMYQKLTQKIAGKPEERILSFLMLRSLKQARYSEENTGHFALAAKTYTHFTSPIRRYPDLVVHRILKDALAESAEAHEGEVRVGQSKNLSTSTHDSPSPWSKRRDHAAHQTKQQELGGPIPVQELKEIADESSQAERRADDAERELMEWKKVKFMEQHVGDDFRGLIVSVTKFGLFIELTDLFVEGLVPLSSLTDDRYFYHENTKEIIGQRSRKTYRLGQQVHVLVDRIDPVEKKIQFALIEEQPTRSKKRRGK